MVDRLRDPNLSDSEQHLLLQIARTSLSECILHGSINDLSEFAITAAMRRKHGAFVTLRCEGELRGCIGYTMNRSALAVTVRDNAINAGTQDPRFPRVEAHELDALAIEISALGQGAEPESPFTPIDDIDAIHIGRDGLYIQRGSERGGLLLPQVATDRGWDVETFLRAVCQKAGYPEGAWRDDDVTLFGFTAQVFSEDQFS
jgi:AmmeMemoRadiSam system protein A